MTGAEFSKKRAWCHCALLELISVVIDGSECLILAHLCSCYFCILVMTSDSFSCKLHRACLSRPFMEPGYVASLSLCAGIHQSLRISTGRQWSPKCVPPAHLLRSTISRSSGEAHRWPQRFLSRETTATVPPVSSRPSSPQSWIAG